MRWVDENFWSLFCISPKISNKYSVRIGLNYLLIVCNFWLWFTVEQVLIKCKEEKNSIIKSTYNEPGWAITLSKLLFSRFICQNYHLQHCPTMNCFNRNSEQFGKNLFSISDNKVPANSERNKNLKKTFNFWQWGYSKL